MSDQRQITLRKLVATLAQLHSVRAIGLSGGERPSPKPGEGDIDVFVYCSEIPAEEERRESLASLPDVEMLEVGKLTGGHWGQGDCFFIAGVETWLLYFTVAGARAELETVLAGEHLGRLDRYYYPIGRCAMWKETQPLYDPDGFLQSLKGRLAEYPQGLALAMVAHHRKALEDVEDLERAVQREDVFFFHFALDLALDHFLQALFALNREYFPSRKRSEEFLRSFKLKPLECEDRLRQVVALGGRAETLGQSYKVWNSLVLDLQALAGTAEGILGK